MQGRYKEQVLAYCGRENQDNLKIRLVGLLISLSKVGYHDHSIEFNHVARNGRERLFFTVPIYRRPQVLGKDQIDTLLEDLLAAYQQKDFLYLGGALVTEQGNRNKIFELIDVQQRFTPFG